MHFLITNDDGIESRFLHAIAAALAQRNRVTLAAPLSEQSWIGRAVSRRRSVAVKRVDTLPWEAWSIDGTPTDCVNIALGCLLKTRPDAVVSGFNIGYNTTPQLISCSGTVAGALEGAFWGLPAFALSQEVPDVIFEQVTSAKGAMPEDWQPVLEASAAHAAAFIEARICSVRAGMDTQIRQRDAIVHNLNYPSRPSLPLRVAAAIPAPLRELPFFEHDGNGSYSFAFQHGESLPSDMKTDRQALANGEISHSILNFSSLGRDLNH